VKGRLGNIQVVFLDAAGTLFDVRGSVGEIYCRFARGHGVVADSRAVQSRFVEAFNRMPPLVFPGLQGPVLLAAERDWWKGLVRQVFGSQMTGEVFERFFGDLFEAFRGPECWQLFPDTPGSLGRLRAHGCRLGIISNFDSRLYDVLASLKIDSLLDYIIVSSYAGAAKPDPAIFHAALASARVKAAEALHVGDSLRVDVRGAQAAGLAAVLMDPQGKQPDVPDGWRIRSLSELCALLGA
jgi:putative hydrolase of the HAD superfamily